MSALHTFFTQRKKAKLASSNPPTDGGSPPATQSDPAIVPSPQRTFHVAIQGCCHGELSRIYAECARHERETGHRIDLLICCGDFQAVRSPADLQSMAVPDKYKIMGDFHMYCRPPRPPADSRPAGPPQRVAPYLTLFVGGNHENSDWLAEESYGGFLADNIYYIGHAGVVVVDDLLVVAGLSGIFKEHDYRRPYPARPYYHAEVSKRSAYHVREIEVAKLQAFAAVMEVGGAPAADAGEAADHSPAQVHVVASHDWPAGITAYGNEAQLLRYKPYFTDEVRRGALGNPHTMALLRALHPPFWLAAHLHCSFRARVGHHNLTAYHPPPSTQFIALDKCAKGSGFLDFIDITAGSSSAPPPPRPHVERQPGDGTAAPFAWTGEARVRRHPCWLRVLQAAHPYVALNQCAGDKGAAGFSIESTVAALRSSSHAIVPPAALTAPSTAALLQALKLSAVVPLQTPCEPAEVTRSRGSRAAYDDLRQECTQPRRRFEPNSTAASFAPAPQAPVDPSPEDVGGPLGWTEDVG